MALWVKMGIEVNKVSTIYLSPKKKIILEAFVIFSRSSYLN